ncbi:PC-Esterase [Dillenia turbinata]|uniref:PC-Esterase n=1 Tax=Dillenia turbinata TaxID=194707 RepID=A0AAN8USJ4_9MAGN
MSNKGKFKMFSIPVDEKNGAVVKLDWIGNDKAWKGYDMLIFNTWLGGFTKQAIKRSEHPGGPPLGSAFVLEVLSKMLKPVTLPDIAELSQLRVDGHPSVYGVNSKGNDCSYWCLW